MNRIVSGMSDKVGEEIVDVDTESGRNEAESDSTRSRKRLRAWQYSPLIAQLTTNQERLKNDMVPDLSLGFSRCTLKGSRP